MFMPRQLKVKTSAVALPNDKKQKLSPSSTGKQSKTDRNVRSSMASLEATVSVEHQEYSVNASSVETELSESEKVKQSSKEQRLAVEGEPVCIVCERYGEYVCDQTDADVCSLECKQQNLEHKRKVNSSVKAKSDRVEVCEANLPQTASSLVDNKATIACNVASVKELSCTGDYDPDSVGSSLNPDQVYSSYRTAFTYREHASLTELTSLQVDTLRKQLRICDNAPPDKALKPICDFSHCVDSELMQRNMQAKNYISPTPVQMQVIPYALCMQDIIVCSATSSGKTLSFVLPLIVRIAAFLAGGSSYESSFCNEANVSYPLGTIISPTRELASQIEEEIKCLAKGLYNIKTALLIGGVPLPPQLHRLKQNVHIIIATPGRLCDVLLLDDSPLHLNYVQTVIIDEVDCMLKMGFQGQIDKIWPYLPRDPQVMVFSATIPESVLQLSKKLSKDPVEIRVGSSQVDNASVKHIVLWVEENSKKKKLFQIVDHEKHFTPPVLIFVESKIGADFLEDAINKMTRRSCSSLHGDKSQKERFSILKRLADGEIEIIVATGVLGRGLDLVQVKQVIHFDFPKSLDEFIHRSGRAGRLGTSGMVVSFVNNVNKPVFNDLCEYLTSVGATVPSELEHSLSRLKRKGHQESSKTRKRLNPSQDYRTDSSLLSLLKNRRK